MHLVKWNDMYSVGNADLDKQHRQILSTLNELYSGCRNNASCTDTGNTIDELIAHIEYHFKFEEEVMAQYRYPAFESHRNSHVSISTRINQIIEANKHRNNYYTAVELMSYLSELATRHIVAADKKYSPFIKQ